MKLKYSIFILGALTFLASCDKVDNYEEPDAFFTGQVVYNNEPIRVGSNQVDFQLWQSGFGKETPLGVTLDQEGKFSARLYSGDYRLAFVKGQGPFRTNIINEQQLDTIFVDLNGNTEMNIEVTPYYLIESAEFTKSGTTIVGKCSINKIIADSDAKDIERVTLYVNKTQFVSDNGDYNIIASDGDFSDLNNINISVDLPETTVNREQLYARIGVRMVGVEDMIFSPVEKIDL